jgi:hypothetical protein
MPPPPNPNPVPPITREILTILRDVDGSEILRLGMHEVTIKQAGGVLEKHTHHDSIRLVDGSMWTPLEMAKPEGAVGACFLCRHPPRGFFRRQPASHGLIRLSNAKTCPCGRLVCAAHREKCDGVWRCLPCARRWRWGQRILGVFFSKE